MAQTGYTPIQLYRTATPSAAPTAGNLSDGELAINTADGKLFYKDSGGSVQVIASQSGATGDVVGPGSSVSNEIALFDGVTGKLIKSATTTGLVKATSGVISAATAGTDYLAPPSGTAILKANSGGALANATAGTDYVAPGTATTFTAKQTFSGDTATLSSKFLNALEAITVSATAATGTINYDVTTQSVLYYTTDAAANWTVNFRASSGTSLDSAMATGECVTVAFLVTQGATAYYNDVVQVDGSSVTPKWQGGTAPTAGNVSSIDAYVYTVVKTGAATFTVFASQTAFA